MIVEHGTLSVAADGGGAMIYRNASHDGVAKLELLETHDARHATFTRAAGAETHGEYAPINFLQMVAPNAALVGVNEVMVLGLKVNSARKPVFPFVAASAATFAATLIVTTPAAVGSSSPPAWSANTAAAE